MSENKHNEIKILGISIWKLFVYFIIYGFAGYVVETLFALATMGVWECRQSFLYGPFLGVYGIGAVCIIVFSQYFKKNNFLLFLGGCVIGSVTEYIVSFGTEILIGTRWWDYSDKILNINGRVCLLYSIFWGILTVFLVKLVNPKTAFSGERSGSERSVRPAERKKCYSTRSSECFRIHKKRIVHSFRR